MKIISIIIFLFFKLSFFAQSINIQKIDSFVNYIESNNRSIGSISIFKNGQEVYNRSFGQSNIEGIKYDSETKYNVGSITKIVTATLIFKLIESKKLKLNDLLSQYFPKIPNANKITIKNLLDHTSGLGDYCHKKVIYIG